MSKKIMGLALAVVSAAVIALPGIASAQEIHFEPPETFTVSGGSAEVRASGEPTITCDASGGTGTFDAGSTTTGKIVMHFTGCHTTIFGLTQKCKTETAGGADTTIQTSGTFHLITVSSGVPGRLVTTVPTTIVCEHVSIISTSGDMISTILSPKCGESSKAMTFSFSATGSTQNQLTYTGANYDLVSKTGSGESRTSALVSTATNTQSNAGKLNCT